MILIGWYRIMLRGAEGSSKSICVRRFSPSPLSLFRFHFSPFPQKRLILRLFHLKQNINRHKVCFTADRDKTQFEKLMLDAYDAVTAVQAEDAEKSLEKLINTRSTNPTKMMNFKNWWWRRRARWQKWCRNYSSSSASSAEVSNAA